MMYLLMHLLLYCGVVLHSFCSSSITSSVILVVLVLLLLMPSCYVLSLSFYGSLSHNPLFSLCG
ncbi:hypothetical protein FB192DRAFT_1360932 [Mucor lusitanicus]|uniref:Uncharacterized protein n=1 Tax=Mucor circinelloides f. lusitanicus TaxID=29924 RepID=A0A8H4BP70_MUCCL|nr:hypothetical protein FB192DRAFT_1360932 [Mucor lusitanicus]